MSATGNCILVTMLTWSYCISFALVLAGIEWIFIIIAKFWICAENSIENTGMFSLPLSPLLPLCKASEGLNSSKDFSASQPMPPVRNLGGQKELWGDTGRTVGPNRPKGYFIPCLTQHIYWGGWGHIGSVPCGSFVSKNKYRNDF